MGKLTFIIGGEKSGKSDYALNIAKSMNLKTAFIGTAKPSDNDMQERIKKHRENRPKNWLSVDSDENLIKAISSINKDYKLIIIDCITLWVSNLLLSLINLPSSPLGRIKGGFSMNEILGRCEKVVSFIKNDTKNYILVSNEVGMGVIPPTKLGVQFAEILGMVNKQIAQSADEVIALVAGIPLTIKEKTSHFNSGKKKSKMRIGTTSYIYPADIIENTKKLIDKVDDIELVLFEAESKSNLPTEEDIKILSALTFKRDISFTIHLPLSLSLGHSIGQERLKSVKLAKKIIELTLPLNPFAYIFHLSITNNPSQKGFFCLRDNELSKWQKRCRNSIIEILNDGVEPSLISIESINYPYNYVEEIINELNLSICLDLGHLLMYSINMNNYLKKYLNKTNIIHIHGIVKGDDHKSIMNSENKKDLIDSVKFIANNDFNGVITIEVFNLKDFEESISVLNKII